MTGVSAHTSDCSANRVASQSLHMRAQVRPTALSALTILFLLTEALLRAPQRERERERKREWERDFIGCVSWRLLKSIEIGIFISNRWSSKQKRESNFSGCLLPHSQPCTFILLPYSFKFLSEIAIISNKNVNFTKIFLSLNYRNFRWSGNNFHTELWSICVDEIWNLI